MYRVDDQLLYKVHNLIKKTSSLINEVHRAMCKRYPLKYTVYHLMHVSSQSFIM